MFMSYRMPMTFFHQTAVGHVVTQSVVISASMAESNGEKSSGTRATGGWKVNSITGQMMNLQFDEDWTLCDKDCGWCGHCAESYPY